MSCILDRQQPVARQAGLDHLLHAVFLVGGHGTVQELARKPAKLVLQLMLRVFSQLGFELVVAQMGDRLPKTMPSTPSSLELFRR